MQGNAVAKRRKGLNAKERRPQARVSAGSIKRNKLGKLLTTVLYLS